MPLSVRLLFWKPSGILSAAILAHAIYAILVVHCCSSIPSVGIQSHRGCVTNELFSFNYCDNLLALLGLLLLIKLQLRWISDKVSHQTER